MAWAIGPRGRTTSFSRSSRALTRASTRRLTRCRAERTISCRCSGGRPGSPNGHRLGAEHDDRRREHLREDERVLSEFRLPERLVVVALVLLPDGQGRLQHSDPGQRVDPGQVGDVQLPERLQHLLALALLGEPLEDGGEALAADREALAADRVHDGGVVAEGVEGLGGLGVVGKLELLAGLGQLVPVLPVYAVQPPHRLREQVEFVRGEFQLHARPGGHGREVEVGLVLPLLALFGLLPLLPQQVALTGLSRSCLLFTTSGLNTNRVVVPGRRVSGSTTAESGPVCLILAFKAPLPSGSSGGSPTGSDPVQNPNTRLPLIKQPGTADVLTRRPLCHPRVGELGSQHEQAREERIAGRQHRDVDRVLRTLESGGAT